MKKRFYELILLINPDKQIDDVKEVVEKLVAGIDLSIVKSDEWKLRTLAFPVKKKLQGRYLVYSLESSSSRDRMDSGLMRDFTNELRISDSIMRFDLIRR